MIIPLIALFAIPFAIAVRKDNVNAHNVASGIIHVVMAIIIAFTAAGTSIVTTVTQTDVYVLADVSYSASKNLDTVDKYISDLSKSLPDHSRMGVICFGRDHQLLTRLGEKVKSVKQSTVDDTATDIVGALKYAGNLFRADVIKRIVLITDGKQTNESDANALKQQADALASKKIHVDAIYLNDNIKDDVREVQLSSVELTQVASLHRAESATVIINCNCPESTTVNGEIAPYKMDAVLTLTMGGIELEKRSVTLQKGVNYESFALVTDEQGVFDYELTITAEEDDNLNNNKFSFTQTVSGELNVLLLASDEADVSEVKKAYGEGVTIDSFRYLQNPDIPRTVEELCRYDEIVLSNVDVSQIDNYQLFLDSLDTVVSVFGKSLVTFGNTSIQNYPKGDLKTLSGMLPVTYGRSDSEKKLYMLVMDTSRSMETLYNFQRAKQAAKQIIEMLDDGDSVGLITFDNQAYRTLAPATLENGKARLLEEIENLTLRNGTHIGSGLEAALDSMKTRDFGEKRVMLFSDGLNFGLGDGNTNIESIVKEMRDYSIYTSVLDVGRGADNGSAATAAKSLLISTAGWGGGSYMDISTDENLENVLNSELPDDMHNPQGGTSFVHVKRRNDAVLKEIKDNDELFAKLENAYVRDYYYSVAKTSATTVLTVNYNEGSKPIECPLYSYWNYGNGRVSTFTSRMTGAWTDSLDSELKAKLYDSVMQTNTPSEKNYTPFLLNLYAHDGYVDVTLTPEAVRPEAKTNVTVTAPDGSIVKQGAMAFGNSTFDLDFVTVQTGRYTVDIEYSYGGRTYTATRYVGISYSAEYDSFTLYDSAVLHKMLGANGTVSEDGKLKIKNDPSEIGLYDLSLMLPMLILCVVLYVVDIAVRKLKWEDIQSLFNKLKRGNK